MLHTTQVVKVGHPVVVYGGWQLISSVAAVVVVGFNVHLFRIRTKTKATVFMRHHTHTPNKRELKVNIVFFFFFWFTSLIVSTEVPTEEEMTTYSMRCCSCRYPLPYRLHFVLVCLSFFRRKDTPLSMLRDNAEEEEEGTEENWSSGNE